MTRWTVEQVLAAAPDSASQVAGRKLATPAPWRNTGWSGELLWGDCLGSGSSPYQVTVDAGSRRWKCSCPSRKFPCKHALGLLFLWAEGRLSESGVIAPRAADFAAQAGKSDSPAETPTKQQTAEQKAAAEQRAARRAARVADGMLDLRRWISDQVANGLSQAARSPYGWSEAVAARMVDAQAPGVASWLRRLPAVIASGQGWPARLLDELALLDLLAVSYGRLDQLPAELAASVRTHVGFPTVSAEVLATRPGVIDTWRVLGSRDSQEEQVTTRRTWLYGVRTGRWALVLAFAAGGVSLDTSLAAGTQVGMALHFPLAALPLRALVGPDPGEAVAMDSWQPEPVDLTTAGRRWREAVAADPWTRTMPTLLTGRLAVGDRTTQLVDDAGAAVPVQLEPERLWSWLARTRGRRCTFAGELSPDGFRPLGFTPLDSARETATRSPSEVEAWEVP